MDNEEKARTRARHERFMRKHHRTREESKEIEAEARRRKAERGGKAEPRRREWDDGDESPEVFEKIVASPSRHRRVPGGGDLPVTTPGVEDPELETSAARVVAVHRDRVLVRAEGARLGAESSLTGELPPLAVGDHVRLHELGGVRRLVSVTPRETVLSRPDPGDPRRELVLAANVEVAVIVAAARRPGFRPALVDRLLVALERGGVTPLLCVNKADLLAAPDELDGELAPYRELGIDVHCTSTVTNAGVDALGAALTGRTCVFAGHSGVGKSTLLNALDPESRRDTGGGRTFDGKGRHTTSASQLVELGDGTRLIDTPGVRAFGLWDVERGTLRFAFPEFEEFARDCRYSDCLHHVEPDCAVRAAGGDGRVPQGRFATYLRILGTLD